MKTHDQWLKGKKHAKGQRAKKGASPCKGKPQTDRRTTPGKQGLPWRKGKLKNKNNQNEKKVYFNSTPPREGRIKTNKKRSVQERYMIPMW